MRGPRCQNDKYAYRAEAQRLLRSHSRIDVLAGTRSPERGLSYAKGPVTIAVAGLDPQGQTNALRITSPAGLAQVYLWDGTRLRPLLSP